MLRAQRIAHREGRLAAVRHRIGGDAPRNPYPANTKRAFNWNWGREYADTVLDQLLGQQP